MNKNTPGTMSDQTIAASPPPHGLESNFSNPPSLFPEMIATVVLCSFLTTAFTLARLFTKYRTATWSFEDCKGIQALFRRTEKLIKAIV